jgi:hypothetical protein
MNIKGIFPGKKCWCEKKKNKRWYFLMDFERGEKEEK